MRRSCNVWLRLGVLALCFLVPGADRLFSQADTGSITGVVKDATGSIVQAARLTLTDPATGLKFTTVTNEDGAYEPEDTVSRDWRDPHTPHYLQAVAEIGKGLDVAASHEGLIGRRFASQPLGIECAHVALGQGAKLQIAAPLCPRKLRRKNQERPNHNEQQENDQSGDLHFEIRECCADVQNAVGKLSGKQRAVCR